MTTTKKRSGNVPNNNHPFNTKSVADRSELNPVTTLPKLASIFSALERRAVHFTVACNATRQARRPTPTRRQTRALSTGTYTWASNGRWRLRSRRVERGCALPGTVQTSCAVLVRCAPSVPALRTGLRDGREAKVRPAAASRGRPSAGTKSQLSHSYHPSIYLHLPIYLPGYHLVANLLSRSI